MARSVDFSALSDLIDAERTEFKRTQIRPAVQRLGRRGWSPTQIAAFFGRALPHLSLDERAELIAAVLTKGDYHPFRDGKEPCDVTVPGHILDAKSVRYRFSYKHRPAEAGRMVSAFRAMGDLPGLVICYLGRCRTTASSICRDCCARMSRLHSIG